MSAARKLIDDLRAAGVRVTRRGDRLHVVADATLTPERKAWLASTRHARSISSSQYVRPD